MPTEEGSPLITTRVGSAVAERNELWSRWKARLAGRSLGRELAPAAPSLSVSAGVASASITPAPTTNAGSGWAVTRRATDDQIRPGRAATIRRPSTGIARRLVALPNSRSSAGNRVSAAVTAITVTIPAPSARLRSTRSGTSTMLVSATATTVPLTTTAWLAYRPIASIASTSGRS